MSCQIVRRFCRPPLLAPVRHNRSEKDTTRQGMRGDLIDIACSALYDLHPVPKINKIFVSAPLLFSHLTVAFDSDDETLSEFERDTEESSLWALIESHLLEQFVDAVDGEGLREQVKVFFRRSICDENVLPDTFSKPFLYKE
jgi:hypothetical protein